jgi:hypothetical protein
LTIVAETAVSKVLSQAGEGRCVDPHSLGQLGDGGYRRLVGRIDQVRQYLQRPLSEPGRTDTTLHIDQQGAELFQRFRHILIHVTLHLERYFKFPHQHLQPKFA